MIQVATNSHFCFMAKKEEEVMTQEVLSVSGASYLPQANGAERRQAGRESSRTDNKLAAANGKTYHEAQASLPAFLIFRHLHPDDHV